MSDVDARYYTQRAEAELELAQHAIVPQAARAHHLLAEAYLERLAAQARAGAGEPT